MYGIYIHALLCFWYIVKHSHIHAKYSACLLCFTMTTVHSFQGGRQQPFWKPFIRFDSHPPCLFEDIRNPSNFLLTATGSLEPFQWIYLSGKKVSFRISGRAKKDPNWSCFFGHLDRHLVPSPFQISASILTKNRSLRLLKSKDPKTDRSLYTYHICLPQSAACSRFRPY